MGGYDAMRDGCVVGRGMGGSRLRGNDVMGDGSGVMCAGVTWWAMGVT